jgi:hypothetical protein
MGMSDVHGQMALFREVCRQELVVISGLRIAELGNQMFRPKEFTPQKIEVPAKLIFTALGATHTSFDRNGRDGSEPCDLAEPLPVQYHGAFDVVTNFGTSEHVDRSQYWCWRNIHELCTTNGLMLHQIPEVGAWPGHGRWHYKLDRVLALARLCRYEMCVARRFEYQEDWGAKRLKHTLLLCFRHCGGDFPGSEKFQQTMFPEGEPWY